MTDVSRSTALEWRRQYEAGATVEQISLDADMYPGKVRKALHWVDTPMRPAKPRKGTRRRLVVTMTDGIKGEPGAPLRKMGLNSNRRGRRRHDRFNKPTKGT